MRALVLAAVAGLAALRGAWALVGVALVSAVVVTVLSTTSKRAARAIDWSVAKAGQGAVHAVSTIGVGMIELVVVLPGRALSLVRRRSALNGARPRPVSTWRPRSPTSGRVQADRPWMRDVPGRRRAGSRGFRALRFLPYLGALVIVDLLAGSMVSGHGQEPWVQPSQQVLGAVEPGVPGVPDGSFASRAGSRALRGDEWAGACLSQADDLRYDYVQYLVRRVRDTAGSCITVTDGIRAGYEPAGADLPVVWLLGGSAAFGVGQRDEHTIASEIARQSETAGRPVRVWNFAVPGFTSYQEALQLEQLLAVRHAPDLVILYDGMNDIGAQVAAPYGEATVLPATLWRSAAPANRRTLWQRWNDRSFLARVLRDYGGLPAGAEGRSGEPGPPANDVAAGSVRVLGRSAGLAAEIGAMHGVPVVSVFQAVQPGGRGAIVDRVLRDLPGGVIDGSGAIAAGDAGASFFDAVHVDEDGAAAVAAWLRDQLAGTVLAREGS